MKSLSHYKVKRAVMDELPENWESQIEELYGSLDNDIERLYDNLETAQTFNKVYVEIILREFGKEKGEELINEAIELVGEY